MHCLWLCPFQFSDIDPNWIFNSIAWTEITMGEIYTPSYPNVYTICVYEYLQLTLLLGESRSRKIGVQTFPVTLNFDRSAPSHYLNQCWNIVNWTLWNKFQWNFNRNSKIFIHENEIESVVCEMAAILSRPQCVRHVHKCLSTPLLIRH